ncbi:MAG: energy transducer TonB [Bacteroidia bacterium]|nr:energy transducer TonB [Bacteroidia bacterium]
MPELETLRLPQGKIEISVQAWRDSVFFLENEHLSVPGRFILKTQEAETDFLSFLKYLNKNLHYPELEHEMGIQGKLYCRIDLDKKGQFLEPEVLKPVAGGPGISKETIRVLKSLPAFRLKSYPFKTKYLIIIFNYRLVYQ